MENFNKRIAQELGLSSIAVENTLKLLAEGATIPFISRYRKEATQGMNEVNIAEVEKRMRYYSELLKRKKTIVEAIQKAGKLTNTLNQLIKQCYDAQQLEDIYLPYKPKRKTKAETARQNGLEPLAEYIWMQREKQMETCAKRFLSKEVENVEQALQGACDIVAERIGEDTKARRWARTFFEQNAIIRAKAVKTRCDEQQALNYSDYFDFEQPLDKCPSHRLLAIRRGEAEGYLKVAIDVPDEKILTDRLEQRFIKPQSATRKWLEKAIADAYKRLLKPAAQNETAAMAKQRADRQAIDIFAKNLRQLLMASPLGEKKVMAIDPGFRTGCKVVCLDQQGIPVYHTTLYPHPPKNLRATATDELVKLTERFGIKAFAIGNGTAGRETLEWVKPLASQYKACVFAVNEDGASVYSASQTARDEFPQYDVTVRGAVSIGRRLVDPLAELVKIEPKSLGVGQYQHDVDQTELKNALHQTVMSCVNHVGVNLNTASRHLLMYVSGVGPVLADNIVAYRNEHGPFTSRKQLMKVPRLGEKAFEQCAGFLRIPDADNPLDNSAVHPESYQIVEKMAADLNCSVKQLLQDKSKRETINPEHYLTDEHNLPTLTDILNELEKPGRDPRKAIDTNQTDNQIQTIDQLEAGMILNGCITNITNFGCFVDLGIKEKGLIHVSQLAEHFVKDPTEAVSLNQRVYVRVLAVDRERNRIQLTMKGVKQA